MFCKNCGKEIDDNAVVCPNCGVATENLSRNTAPVVPQRNSMAIAGFILSLLGSAIIGLILSIIGFNNSKKPEYAGDGRGLAIAGIVISSIVTAAYIILIGSCSAIVGCAALEEQVISLFSMV